MNAYGPSFHHLTQNKPVFEYATVHPNFIVAIDLKLDDHSTVDERSNVYGLMEAGSVYPNEGSQIPAVFIRPNSNIFEICVSPGIPNSDKLEICLTPGIAFTPNEWFTLAFGSFCSDECSLAVQKDDEVEGPYWINNSWNQTWYDVSGIIGNTYNWSDLIAATGEYMNFYLDSEEDQNDLSFFVTTEPDKTGAENYTA